MISGRLSLSLLRLVLGAVLAWYSAVLAVRQLHHQGHSPLLAITGAELLASILFLLPKTMRVGGIALLVVFAIAAAFHIVQSEYDVAYLAIYGAAVIAVLANAGTGQ